ncbi:hypothetical protein TRFO_12817 [Tritrichomonas foetus]|uniref:Uncharacterized protein n=1 Tax=Tritrichomonas foetus TaxID=1144522 RepID=A0A1J4L4S4_9EUKA|nr:hypothetical protein TRFO_12817 [Tritrichomonas foetus]|eukprot:OHT16933.1 hypothetical protein TRFO_12817 [Tritrichomonas foetus]
MEEKPDEDQQSNNSSMSDLSANEYLASIRERKSEAKNNQFNTPKDASNNSISSLDSEAPNSKSPKNPTLYLSSKSPKMKMNSNLNDNNLKDQSNEHQIDNKNKKKTKGKRKRKTSNFNPEKYQNRKPKMSPDLEEKLPSPKRKNKKDIEDMVLRLSAPSPQSKIEEKPKKIASDPQIFDRLYEMSKDKEKKNEEMRAKFIAEEKNKIGSPKRNPLSQKLAEKRLLRFINEKFEEIHENELSQTELNSLLIEFGLTFEKQRMENNKLLLEYMKEWILNVKENGETAYDPEKVKNCLLTSIKSTKNASPFQAYARQSIIIALSNTNSNKSSSKSPNNSPCKPENQNKFNQYNASSKNISSKDSNLNDNIENNRKSIKYESLIRLSKSNKPPTPRKSLPKRPKFVQYPYSEDLEPVSVCQGSERILNSSRLAQKSFNERDKILKDRKIEKLNQMEQEFYKSQLMTFEHKPNFNEQTQKELEAYREKKKNIKPEEPSFHPTVIDYEKYKKTIHKSMIEKVVRPEGWESDIVRHRLAYQNYLFQKTEKKENQNSFGSSLE